MTRSTSATTASRSLLDAGLQLFAAQGYAATTVAQLCRAAGASNGSFFHHFGSKDGLAGALFVEALRSYHAQLLDRLSPRISAASGIERLIRSHLDWVVDKRPAAQFLFEQHRAEWLGPFRDEQAAQNAEFAHSLEAWRAPWVESGQLTGMPALLFFSQLIGPAQMLCRAWLSRPGEEDPRRHARALTQLAQRALVAAPDTDTDTDTRRSR